MRLILFAACGALLALTASFFVSVYILLQAGTYQKAYDRQLVSFDNDLRQIESRINELQREVDALRNQAATERGERGTRLRRDYEIAKRRGNAVEIAGLESDIVESNELINRLNADAAIKRLDLSIERRNFQDLSREMRQYTARETLVVSDMETKSQFITAAIIPGLFILIAGMCGFIAGSARAFSRGVSIPRVAALAAPIAVGVTFLPDRGWLSGILAMSEFRALRPEMADFAGIVATALLAGLLASELLRYFGSLLSKTEARRG